MFALPKTPAKLTSVTPRREKHGEDDVPAVSLAIKITGPNTLLDKLSPTLRTTIYSAPPGQTKPLEGVEQATTVLRTPGIEYIAAAGVLEGWNVVIKHGIADDSDVSLSMCKIDKFRVYPKEGGSIDLTFRVSTSDFDQRAAGILAMSVEREIDIIIRPPTPKQAKEAAEKSEVNKARGAQAKAEAAGQRRLDEGEGDAGSSTGAESKAKLDAGGRSPFPKGGAKTDAELAADADNPEKALTRAAAKK